MTDPRFIELSGVANFRDYGGYSVAGGGRVKTGLLWRSGEHGKASDADLDRIAGLRLRHVIDLRGNGERDASPCRRHPDFNGEVLYYDGDTGGLAPLLEERDGRLTEEDAHEAMEAIYGALPTRANLLWIMKRYFAALAKDPQAADDGIGGGTGRASLVHCHAGKDRTGMAVALLHHILGVHGDDAMADYLLTNDAADLDARVAEAGEGIRQKYGDMDDAAVRALMGVDERYLIAARRAVKEACGSVDGFLADLLDVDAARADALRLHLLEA